MLKRSDTTSTRHGASRNESTMSKSAHNQQAALNSKLSSKHEEAKRKVSLTTSLTAEVTQSTHIRDSGQVRSSNTEDSADEVMLDRNSAAT